MNKHKTFIKECYEGKHGSMCSDWKTIIEKHYPEFKTSLEVGKWYRNGDAIGFFKGFETESYGVHSCGDWIDEQLWFDERQQQKWTLATKEEVGKALIAEAKKRGFKHRLKGCALRDTTYKKDGSVYDKNTMKIGSRFEYSDKTNTLYTYGYGRYVLFENGKWAEMIEPKKKMSLKDIEKELGYEVELIA